MNTVESKKRVPVSTGDDVRVLKAELKYFLKIKQKLLADPTYHGKFVAIKDKKVIDLGVDEFDLGAKLAITWPNDVIIIKKVVADDAVFDLSSPEVKK